MTLRSSCWHFSSSGSEAMIWKSSGSLPDCSREVGRNWTLSINRSFRLFGVQLLLSSVCEMLALGSVHYISRDCGPAYWDEGDLYLERASASDAGIVGGSLILSCDVIMISNGVSMRVEVDRSSCAVVDIV